MLSPKQKRFAGLDAAHKKAHFATVRNKINDRKVARKLGLLDDFNMQLKKTFKVFVLPPQSDPIYETLCRATVMQGNAAINAYIERETDRRFRLRLALYRDGNLNDPYWTPAKFDALEAMSLEDARLEVRRVNAARDRTLQNLAADRQNVHTTAVVNTVMKNLQCILRIPVPEEYRWNKVHCSLTPVGIMGKIPMRPDTVREMVMRYTSSDSVYEMGEGIYGRVLDGVWQFIQNSEHKADLMKILAAELEDNIGMCAQGNLSRLCNVLNGYLDGLDEEDESPSEKAGKMLAGLADVEGLIDRIGRARQILDALGIVGDAALPWLDSVAAMRD